MDLTIIVAVSWFVMVGWSMRACVSSPFCSTGYHELRWCGTAEVGLCARGVRGESCGGVLVGGWDEAGIRREKRSLAQSANDEGCG